MIKKKIIDINLLKKKIKILKKKKIKIVHCHGKFDYLHFGHLKHLEEAKKLGDILIVTITKKKNQNNNQSIFFDDQIRLNNLSDLNVVDYVALSPYDYAYEIIKIVKPNFYCKGLEYKKYDKFYDKEILNDIKAAKEINAKVRFVGKNILSSSKLINKDFRKNDIEKFSKFLPNDLSIKKLEKIFNQMSKKNVLVIGDFIFDRYTYVKVKGLASKNTIISSVYEKSENYIGGAGAVYMHLSDFVSKNLKLVSLANLNDSKSIEKKFDNSRIFGHKNFKTIIKNKFVEQNNKNFEIRKFFSVATVNESFYDKKLEEKIVKYLKKECKKYDLVLILDFGHNFITKAIIKTIITNSKFVSVNCQTNSLNYGFNIISNKFKNIHSFALDNKEFSLAINKNNIKNFLTELTKLKKLIKSKFAWLTIGSKFTIGLDMKNKNSIIKSLNEKPIDTIGAGDAFFAISSLLSTLKVDIKTSTFLSQVCGAIHANEISNRYFLTRKKVINFIKSKMI